MAQDTPKDRITKRLDTPSAPDFIEMQVIRHCLAEGMKAFELYFVRMEQADPNGGDESAITQSLFRDGLVQVMGCFTTNPAKRHRYLIPSEAFEGVDGWETFYQWMLDYRDTYAAHNFGPHRLCEVMVTLKPDSLEVIEVGHFTMVTHGPSVGSGKPIQLFCETAISHCEARLAVLKSQLIDEANALSFEARNNLQPVEVTVPDGTDARLSRGKYRKKLEGSQPPRPDRPARKP